MDNNVQRGLVDPQGKIDLNDPDVKARVEYLGAHAERSLMQDFIAKHPELLNVDMQTDIRNKEAIDAVLNQNGLRITPETLEWSYRVALEAGQLTLPMYSAAEEQAFPQMTTKQMAEYLKQKYQAPRPPNAAELLPQFGERTWRSDTPTMDEEACAALRANLLAAMK